MSQLQPPSWDAFFSRIKAIYWPALAPWARETSWPGHDAATGPSPVPDDVWQAALMVYPNPSAWLENPVPQLKGRTPLEALRRGQVDDVRGTIMAVADFFLADPSEVAPWPDDAPLDGGGGEDAEPGGAA
jgi:hypothetical protein